MVRKQEKGKAGKLMKQGAAVLCLGVLFAMSWAAFDSGAFVSGAFASEDFASEGFASGASASGSSTSGGLVAKEGATDLEYGVVGIFQDGPKVSSPSPAQTQGDGGGQNQVKVVPIKPADGASPLRGHKKSNVRVVPLDRADLQPADEKGSMAEPMIVETLPAQVPVGTAAGQLALERDRAPIMGEALQVSPGAAGVLAASTSGVRTTDAVLGAVGSETWTSSAMKLPQGQGDGQTEEDSFDWEELKACFLLPTPPAVSAESAMVIDGETGRILYEKNAEETRGIASTTKIMTALCVLEQTEDLEKIVRVPDQSVYYPGSCFMLKPGERLSILDLLYGLLLQSGNDAGDALARLTSGSVEDFCEQMNARAASLGAVHTHFNSPHGYPKDGGHYSTAKDMCLIAREALENETFREIVGTERYHSGRKDPEYTMVENKNRVIFDYEGGILGKTGYTTEAGRCLVSAAERNGTTLICVVLASEDVYRDSYRLLDYGFAANGVCPAEGDSPYRLELMGSGVELPLLQWQDTNYVSLDKLETALTGSGAEFSFAWSEDRQTISVTRTAVAVTQDAIVVTPAAVGTAQAAAAGDGGAAADSATSEAVEQQEESTGSMGGPEEGFTLKQVSAGPVVLVFEDGSRLSAGAISINGDPYVRVRDLGTILNQVIGWNQEAGTFNLVVNAERNGCKDSGKNL